MNAFWKVKMGLWNENKKKSGNKKRWENRNLRTLMHVTSKQILATIVPIK